MPTIADPSRSRAALIRKAYPAGAWPVITRWVFTAALCALVIQGYRWPLVVFMILQALVNEIIVLLIVWSDHANGR